MDSLDHQNLVLSLRNAAHVMTSPRTMRDLETMLTDLVTAAVQTVPGATGGGITRAEGTTLHSSHGTAADITALDQAQSDLGEGPCITAASNPGEITLIVVDDLAGADAPRWPRFAPLAVDSGYRSMLSVPLSLHRANRFALNFYAPRPGTLDTTAQLAATLFGLQATVLLHGVEHATQLGRGLETRDMIGQAKGILMERFTIDDDEAFHMLVRSSQDTNMKLADVARWLTGETNQRRTLARRDGLSHTATETATE